MLGTGNFPNFLGKYPIPGKWQTSISGTGLRTLFIGLGGHLLLPRQWFGYSDPYYNLLLFFKLTDQEDIIQYFAKAICITILTFQFISAFLQFDFNHQDKKSKIIFFFRPSNLIWITWKTKWTMTSAKYLPSDHPQSDLPDYPVQTIPVFPEQQLFLPVRI